MCAARGCELTSAAQDFGPELGLDLGSDLSAARTSEITRRYVRAFLQRHLGGDQPRPQPLLDSPSAEYPEVGLCAPERDTCA